MATEVEYEPTTEEVEAYVAAMGLISIKVWYTDGDGDVFRAMPGTHIFGGSAFGFTAIGEGDVLHATMIPFTSARLIRVSEGKTVTEYAALELKAQHAKAQAEAVAQQAGPTGDFREMMRSFIQKRTQQGSEGGCDDPSCPVHGSGEAGL